MAGGGDREPEEAKPGCQEQGGHGVRHYKLWDNETLAVFITHHPQAVQLRILPRTNADLHGCTAQLRVVVTQVLDSGDTLSHQTEPSRTHGAPIPQLPPNGGALHPCG